MLTSDDLPTIEFAIRRRLDQEKGVFVFLPIPMQAYRRGDWYVDKATGLWVQAREPFIRVRVMLEIGKTILMKSRFDLPDPFEHGHLLNEIDEMAEGVKKARKGFFSSPLVEPERKIPGTGLRGRWAQYGTPMGKHG